MSSKHYAQSITGTVSDVRTVGHSLYGNPTKEVTLDTSAGTVILRTTGNSMLAYGIGNPEYRDAPHEFGLTRSGRLNGHNRKVEA